MLYALLTVRFSVHILASISELPLIKCAWYCLLVIETIGVVFISRILLTLPKEVAACFHWFGAKLPQMPLYSSFLCFAAIIVEGEGLFSACSVQGAFSSIFQSWDFLLVETTGWLQLGEKSYRIEYFSVRHHLDQKGRNKFSRFPPCALSWSELLQVRENWSNKAIK